MFGDWMCGQCDQHNFARRETCYKCNKPRGSVTGISIPLHQLQEGGGRVNAFDAPLPPREDRPALPPTAHLGDWICPNRPCHAHNFASRDTCYKCACPRNGREQTVTAKPVNAAWNSGAEFVVGRGFVS